ncbi:MAG: tetraacyldisaccharide 4'-kinase [Zoogloeaceae bacterium]|jgi:tetraacyldisaccharide 4'-kinase|nr:tetraacyldisaccharide 4'-kinase [Zoogloeaceae bacterium]
MRHFRDWLCERWYTPRFSLALFWLLPFAALFAALIFLRRLCYASGLLRAERLPVPVIVIGNLTVGGTGKTPLVLALAEALREKGWRPGIISRGYGGRHTRNSREPCLVLPDADPLETGDEPLLLARRSGLPVWIGRDRRSAGVALLAAHPETDCLLCDDGLQHYRLARDLEIVVFDERGCGNGCLLPVGPLREPVSRLDRADILITRGSPELPNKAARVKPGFAMRLEAGDCYRLTDPSERRPVSDFRAQPLHAVAGIGHPARFFSTLENLGLACTPHPFPDHHPYTPEDLAFPSGETILMTEKDGVKCARLNLPNAWVLPVTARISPEFVAFVVARIREKTL